MTKYSTDDDVLRQLRRECRELGSQAEWARRNDFTRAFISDLLAGRRDVTDRLAAALGFERVREWRRINGKG